MSGVLHGVLGAFKSTRLWWLKVRGRLPEEIAERRVADGTAWEEFCERLKSAGAALAFPGAPTDGFQQAEGVRYLTRLTRAALEAFVEYNDPMFPELRCMVHETVKMGADNPDNLYLNAQIDGNMEYIITGNRNSVHYIGFFTQNGNYGSTGGLTPCGVLEGKDLVVNPDGTFEVHLAQVPIGPNWLKTESDTGLVMVRQTFFDRQKEQAADLRIRAVNAPTKPSPLKAAQLDERLKTASLFVAGAPLLFANWVRGFQRHPNRLPLFDPEVSNNAGGDANILYYHSYWKLEEGECLVIHTQVPECDTWNFQLNNYWMESLDYRFHNICINGATAEEEEDGTLVVVVSHRDPEHPNWIETCGHREGTMCWRWYRPKDFESAPEPSTDVMKLEEVKERYGRRR